jgi:ribosome biogenesis protein ERB1
MPKTKENVAQMQYAYQIWNQKTSTRKDIYQKMVKKLLSGCKWLSSIDVHQSGDHVIVGSYDRRLVWFDLDLSSTPYKTLKFHEKALRSVCFHRRYPLFASASDDGSVHVFHSTVYKDLERNPMVVPLKVLKGHGSSSNSNTSKNSSSTGSGKGVLSVVWHPRQPWVFSAGSDGVINLYQDLM